MEIGTNKVVELSYELEVDGKIVDRAGEERPLDYIHGTKMLLPKFESELEGKTAGDLFEFTLTPEEGYGEYDPKLVVELPETAFSINGEVQRQMLFVGNMIPMLNSAGMVEGCREGTQGQHRGDGLQSSDGRKDIEFQGQSHFRKGGYR